MNVNTEKMNLVINNKSEKPIYEQLYEQISSQILNEDLPVDYCLPSIRTVAVELGISVITVKKAYEVLESNDFIYTRAGKGCFVKSHKRPLGEIRLQLAEKKLQADFPYYKNLNITEKEMHELVTIIYSNNKDES